MNRFSIHAAERHWWRGFLREEHPQKAFNSSDNLCLCGARCFDVFVFASDVRMSIQKAAVFRKRGGSVRFRSPLPTGTLLEVLRYSFPGEQKTVAGNRVLSKVDDFVSGFGYRL